MGCASAEQETNQTSDFTQKTTFDKRTPAEQAILDQLSGLGGAQQGALLQELQRLSGGASPFALSQADQDLLDTRYRSAEEQLALQGKDYADMLAGGRGLRMSDSPIASQALQRYGLGLSSLLSDKANTSLNMGLQGSQYRTNAALGLSSALPSGSVAAFNPQFQERLAGGTTRTQGQTSGTTISTPSLMSQIGQGIGLAGQLGAMAAPFLAPGVGSLGALGGGAAGNAGNMAAGNAWGSATGGILNLRGASPGFSVGSFP